jgi:hypothetical protein
MTNWNPSYSWNPSNRYFNLPNFDNKNIINELENEIYYLNKYIKDDRIDKLVEICWKNQNEFTDSIAKNVLTTLKDILKDSEYDKQDTLNILDSIINNTLSKDTISFGDYNNLYQELNKIRFEIDPPAEIPRPIMIVICSILLLFMIFIFYKYH